MLPLHSVVYYYYFRNITGTSNKDPTSKMSCGRSRGFDGSQRFAHDSFPSCGRKPGTEHSPYQLTEISWQDDGSPITLGNKTELFVRCIESWTYFIVNRGS